MFQLVKLVGGTALVYGVLPYSRGVTPGTGSARRGWRKIPRTGLTVDVFAVRNHQAHYYLTTPGRDKLIEFTAWCQKHITGDEKGRRKSFAAGSLQPPCNSELRCTRGSGSRTLTEGVAASGLR